MQRNFLALAPIRILASSSSPGGAFNDGTRGNPVHLLQSFLARLFRRALTARFIEARTTCLQSVLVVHSNFRIMTATRHACKAAQAVLPLLPRGAENSHANFALPTLIYRMQQN